MKKILLVMVLCAFGAAPLFVVAHEKSTKGTKAEKVYCCHETGPEKGKCDKLHAKDECEKEGGRVVNSCRECK